MKFLLALSSPLLSPTLQESLAPLVKAIRSNPNLRRKKVLVHGDGGKMFYAYRMVAHEEHPQLFGGLPQITAPKPTTRPRAPVIADSEKARVAAENAPTPAQMSLFDAPLPQFVPKERPRIKAKPKGDGGTLSLFDTPAFQQESAPVAQTITHEPNTPTSPDGHSTAANGDNKERNTQDAATAGSEPIRGGIHSVVDTLRAGDGGAVDKRGDSQPTRQKRAGANGRGNRDAHRTGTDVPRSGSRRSEETAPATDQRLNLTGDTHDAISVEDTHHYEDGVRVRGAALEDETISSQEPTPDTPPPAQTFEGDQTADVREALGTSTEGGVIESPAQPLYTQTPQQEQVARRARELVGLSESIEDRNAKDLQLTDEDEIGLGSLSQKAADNFIAINLLQTIESENREATEDEKHTLARFVGWGMFGQAFQDQFERFKDVTWEEIPPYPRNYWSAADKGHFELFKQLRSQMTDEEFKSARESTKNAHYTAPKVVRAMWDAVAQFGFEGGRVLEPAMGTGNFFGFMPPELAARSKRTGVELDSVTGRIARLCYPGAQIHIKGFEETALPDNCYDVAIGNVPFGDYGVHDPQYLKDGRKSHTAKIHNYFFSKTLDKVRPGGLIAFVTSTGTLDAKTSSDLREAWSRDAHFLGAIRLPNDAFAENAGTKVTTDIVFLQKKDPAFEALHPRDALGHFIEKWTGNEQVDVRFQHELDDPNARTYSTPVNEYYAAHPEMMLGRMALGAGLYRADQAGLVSDGRDVAEALHEAIANGLPRDVLTDPSAVEQARIKQAEEARLAPQHVKPGAFHVDGYGTLSVNRRGALIPLEADVDGKDAKKRARIIAQVRLLDVARNHLALEREDTPDQELSESRAELNSAYDEFKAEWGELHQRQNVSAFAADPDAGLLLSLEKKDKETGTVSKADVFSKRTLTPIARVETAQNATDALGITLNEHGELNWRRMSELLGRDPESIRDELAGAGLIFRVPGKEEDPVTAGWQTADEYLSGEVKDKLRLAKSIAEVDPSYSPNVAALEAVQPEPLLPSQVSVKLGATWVAPKHVNDFVEHLIGRGWTDTIIGFSKASGWTVNALDSRDSRRGSAAMVSQWGTERIHALGILESVLNMQEPTVTDPHPDDPKKRVTNATATLAARAKAQDIRDEWLRWLDSEPKRMEGLCEQYNDLFNNTRARTYDGSHLTFPGMNPHFAKGFRQHARDAVWRAVQSGGNVLFDHVVGAGKTGCIAATAMEMRRLGTAKKPVVVVRNPQLEQWEREFREIYPSAKLLVINEGMGNAAKRKELCAQIATGDWDAVIMAQSTFKEIPASPKLYANFIEEQLNELRDQLNEEKAHALAQGEKKASKAQKQIENAIAKLQTKLKDYQAQIASHQDDSLDFDELGVDALLVDEAHDYKNLAFVTRMGRVAGLNNAASQKAMDMFVKSQHMVSKGGKLVFATGTPVSNTLSEMWTMKRYLMLDTLKKVGLERFDSWAANFGETTTAVEKAPEGGFRQRTRFARFVNVPEMISLYRRVADVRTREDLKHILPTPKLESGEPIINSAPASDALRAYMDTLQERAKKLQTGTVDPRDDNFLKITSDGRKAALHLRLVAPSAKDDPNGKVSMCAANVVRLHSDSKERKATQLIFLDLGTPSGAKKSAGKNDESPMEGEGADAVDGEEAGLRDSVYGDLKRKLIAQGIPESEVAFAHDFDTPAKRKEMSRMMDTGQLRVLIGSTMKMGVGLNVQKRLYAVHHLDCPWKPGELEQRDGRILRQGNLHHESQWDVPVQIHRYGTQNSFDEYMWQAVAKKAAFIAQTRRGDCARTCEDMDDTVMTAASMQAALSDNPLLGEKATVDADAYKYTQLRKGWLDARFAATRKMAALPVRRQKLLEHAAQCDKAAEHYEANKGSKFGLTVGLHTFGERESAGGALEQALINAHDEAVRSARGVKVGSFNGFDLVARHTNSNFDAWDMSMPNLALEIRLPTGGSAQLITRGSSAAGTTTKLDNALKSYANQATEARRGAHEAQTQLAQYEDLSKKPFEHQEKLDAALKRQKEIEDELAKGGDADTVTAENEEGSETTKQAPLAKSLTAAQKLMEVLRAVRRV